MADALTVARARIAQTKIGVRYTKTFSHPVHLQYEYWSDSTRDMSMEEQNIVYMFALHILNRLVEIEIYL